ncbi:MAG TPA: transglycosylase SLT domain-containing protein [Levilinea sp.]|nr:transglycosylase SLT domain-containing protein [Levilinea sp.]
MSRHGIRILLAGLIIGLSSLMCVLPNISIPFLHDPTPTQTETPTLPSTFTITPSPTPTITPTPQPAERVLIADEAIFFGDYERAVTENQSLLDSTDDPEIRAGALFGIGKAQYKLKNYSAAIRALTELIDQYPDSHYLANAHFVRGESYFDRSEFLLAAADYQRYLELKPGVLDSFVAEVRGNALMAAGSPEQAIEAYQFAIETSERSDISGLEIKIGRAYAASGDHIHALRRFMAVYENTNNDFTRAQVNLLAGQSYLALELPEQAHARFQDSVHNYPMAFDSYTGLVILVNANVPVDDLQRGIVNYYAGQYGLSIVALDRFMQNNPNHNATPLHYKALSKRALGEPAEAVDLWDTIITGYAGDQHWATAWKEKAHTQWAFLDQFPQAAQTLLDYVAMMPTAADAADILFQAGRIYERNHLLPQAAAVWERLMPEYPSADISVRAQFLAGITHYRMDNKQTALNIFQRGLVLATRPEDQAAASLWIGKILMENNDRGGAISAWEQAAQTGSGYYAQRASELLENSPPFFAPDQYNLDYDLEHERRLAEMWMRSTFELPEATDFSGLGELTYHPALRRGNALYELGLYRMASAEFEALRNEIHSDALKSYRLLHHMLELGYYRQAIFLSRNVLDLAGLDETNIFTAPAFFNHVRFGIYYKDIILEAAETEELHPFIIYSVVRQESLFDSHARSSAGAIGLMQIMPATGQEIAGQLRWPENFVVDDLYRPFINVRFGAHYLARQRRAFDGDLYATLAAYNGGPGNTYFWHQLAPDDPDLFLEVVRAAETRTYIMQIAMFMQMYRRMYEPGDVIRE